MGRGGGWEGGGGGNPRGQTLTKKGIEKGIGKGRQMIEGERGREKGGAQTCVAGLKMSPSFS